jgi:hypothetical protein
MGGALHPHRLDEHKEVIDETCDSNALRFGQLHRHPDPNSNRSLIPLGSRLPMVQALTGRLAELATQPRNGSASKSQSTPTQTKTAYRARPTGMPISAELTRTEKLMKSQPETVDARSKSATGTDKPNHKNQDALRKLVHRGSKRSRTAFEGFRRRSGKRKTHGTIRAGQLQPSSRPPKAG